MSGSAAGGLHYAPALVRSGLKSTAFRATWGPVIVLFGGGNASQLASNAGAQEAGRWWLLAARLADNSVPAAGALVAAANPARVHLLVVATQLFQVHLEPLSYLGSNRMGGRGAQLERAARLVLSGPRAGATGGSHAWVRICMHVAAPTRRRGTFQTA